MSKNYRHIRGWALYECKFRTEPKSKINTWLRFAPNMKEAVKGFETTIFDAYRKPKIIKVRILTQKETNKIMTKR